MNAPVAQRGNVSEYRLANGLRVVLAPNPSSREVFLHLVYRTGSLADPVGQGGMAHLLEHMMFKGTLQRTGEQWVNGMRERVVDFHAATGFDHTRYSAQLDTDPAHLDGVLALEAERMAGLRLEDGALKAELVVVRREAEQALSNDIAALRHRMRASATPAHGLGRHVLGTRQELEHLGVADLRRFHQAHYRPDNAVIVVSGGFETSHVLASVSRHFSHLAAAPDPQRQQEPLRLMEKPTMVHMTRGNTDLVLLAYPLPPALDMRNVALASAADVLAVGPQGRLYRALVATGKAQSVFAFRNGFAPGGYILFGALLAPGQSKQEAQALMVEQLESLARHPFTPEELRRVQAGIASAMQYVLGASDALADVLADAVAMGDWRLTFERLDHIAALELTEVQREAESHFVPQRRLVGLLNASESAPAPPPAARPPERANPTPD